MKENKNGSKRTEITDTEGAKDEEKGQREESALRR